MTGFTKLAQVSILDSSVGFSRTLYLALFKWSGTSGQGAGVEPNDDGTMPTSLAEVTGGGYARQTVASTVWSSTTAGAIGTATSKQCPATGQSAITWTASGAAFGEITSFGFYDASTAGNLVFSGVLTDSSGAPVSRTINDGDSFSFTSANPIVARIGDPAKVVDASAGTQRTVPT